MHYDEILYQVEQRVAMLTLNRPDKLNAWTMHMEEEVGRAIRDAASDESVRAIVIAGAGRGFCAGADMSLLSAVVKGGAPAGNLGEHQRKHSWLLEIPKPIIAAINGPAVGLGLVIPLFCDIRFASDRAKFSTIFAKRGLVAEYGMAWMLPRIVGLANAADLLFSARTIDAGEALRMGLVNRVIAHDGFLEAVKAYARELTTAVSPRSLRIMKNQIYQSQAQSLDQAVDLATEEMYGSFGTEDFKEGVAHFLEKRAAAFTGK
jgi:enoyl-CoA hydratase/carnithine racemase